MTAPDLAEITARFGEQLRAVGIPVTAQHVGRFAEALSLARPATLRELYWSARVTLLSDRDQLPVFERVFARVFGVPGRPEAPAGHAAPAAPHAAPVPGSPTPSEHRGGARDAVVGVPGEEVEGDRRHGETVAVATSRSEQLRTKDFSQLNDEELRAVRELFRQLSISTPHRRGRRHRRDRNGRRLAMRATLARAHRTAGDPLRLVHRSRRPRPRPLVLLCDISGSMEAYSRAYLQLLHSAVGGARAEAFVFATRLTRLTRSLAVRDPDVALERAGLAAPDWSSGTRIGEAVRAFNDEHGRRGMARGAVVVIVSDGWERDDPALLGREMGRLARLAHRIVWVNPRRADPRYRPLVAGMAAALPHVDAFVSGHRLAAMDEVLAAIAGRSPDPVRR